MGAKSVDVTIAGDLVPYLRALKDGKTINDKITFSTIVGLFAAKTITMEKAAELMGKSVWDFMDILKKYQIPWGECTEESLQMDAAALEKLAGGYYG